MQRYKAFYYRHIFGLIVTTADVSTGLLCRFSTANIVNTKKEAGRL